MARVLTVWRELDIEGDVRRPVDNSSRSRTLGNCSHPSAEKQKEPGKNSEVIALAFHRILSRAEEALQRFNGRETLIYLLTS
jgi:hypothetical protein